MEVATSLADGYHGCCEQHAMSCVPLIAER